ncbi:hypothetical protein [Poseidonocella sedimentorum]|uniref:hypothetical protein n=1 Tax=Poseidonocella sedimentorum TaxID=871652 RepID=UPI000B8061A5|nr:hypothetical protein [Poseidonocella sedimentorum]
MPGITQAQDSAGDLDALFAELRAAETAQDAARTARRIERIWGKSGSASVDLLLERGRDAMEEGDTAAAVEHFSAATDHAPGWAHGYTLRAEAFFMAERFGPALEDIAVALAAEPRDFRALTLFGAIMLHLDEMAHARDAFARLATIHPLSDDLSTLQEQVDLATGELEL